MQAELRCALEMLVVRPRTCVGRRAQPADRRVVEATFCSDSRLRGTAGRQDPAIDPGDLGQAAQFGLVVELKQLVLGAVSGRIGHPAQQDVNYG
jgi:hypothetical protein